MQRSCWVRPPASTAAIRPPASQAGHAFPGLHPVPRPHALQGARIGVLHEGTVFPLGTPLPVPRCRPLMDDAIAALEAQGAPSSTRPTSTWGRGSTPSSRRSCASSRRTSRPTSRPTPRRAIRRHSRTSSRSMRRIRTLRARTRTPGSPGTTTSGRSPSRPTAATPNARRSARSRPRVRARRSTPPSRRPSTSPATISTINGPRLRAGRGTPSPPRAGC